MERGSRQAFPFPLHAEGGFVGGGIKIGEGESQEKSLVCLNEIFFMFEYLVGQWTRAKVGPW